MYCSRLCHYQDADAWAQRIQKFKQQGQIFGTCQFVEKESAEFSECKKEIPNNEKYMSWMSLNALLYAAALCVKDVIEGEAAQTACVSDNDDGTRDISVTEQLSIMHQICYG